jgi:MFS family permease
MTPSWHAILETQMPNPGSQAQAGQKAALAMSTIAFTVCFAAWTIFAIIGIRIKQELNLTETQFGLMVGTPILTGSLIRVVLGIWTDRYGGRLMFVATMLAAAAATFALTFATTLVSPGKAGNGTRHLRRRQCRLRSNEVPGTDGHGGLGLARSRPDLGRGAGGYGRHLLVRHQG